mmetsp:Transcript_57561/g.65673  ORF Transcript_57561/g.65673 Transcript_57561/m.65673 type:complete len:229 (-) Transcript_57561:1077-1763(-)|eukprot:CAMPEP_0115007946 /NCGR_PEP_ID=MMETSP0216-20121206/21573_1 /TAXON_ID=223996 /ORGANISM="Protocruzia adherens, Strain Boccale" /LENGTH=228 /DNA_ID=CAMNT_0002375167 /DNA_START=48 /DNA_END=734 /DNA_ORIENTATION=+
MAKTPSLGKVHGDRCTFCMFRFCNFFLSFVGAAIFGLAVYLWAIVKVFTVFTAIFMALGALTIVTAIWGWKSRYSTASLILYQIFLFLIWVSQLVGTILLFVYTNTVIEWAHEHDNNHESIEHLKKDFDKHLDVIKYGAMAAAGIQFFCLIFGYYYRRSIFNKKDRLLIDHNAQSLFEFDASTPATDARRAELMEKYPDLANKLSRRESEQSSSSRKSNKKKNREINL